MPTPMLTFQEFQGTPRQSIDEVADALLSGRQSLDEHFVLEGNESIDRMDLDHLVVYISIVCILGPFEQACATAVRFLDDSDETRSSAALRGALQMKTISREVLDACVRLRDRSSARLWSNQWDELLQRKLVDHKRA